MFKVVISALRVLNLNCTGNVLRWRVSLIFITGRATLALPSLNVLSNIVSAILRNTFQHKTAKPNNLLQKVFHTVGTTLFSSFEARFAGHFAISFNNGQTMLSCWDLRWLRSSGITMIISPCFHFQTKRKVIVASDDRTESTTKIYWTFQIMTELRYDSGDWY